MAKEGSTVGGLMDAFGTAISMSLQYGVPVEVLVNKFSHTRFEPMGHTTNPDIRVAKSVVDYIFRWLGITFMPGYREANSGTLKNAGESKAESNGNSEPAGSTSSGSGAHAELPGTSPRTGENPIAARETTKVELSPPDRAALDRAGVAMHIDENGGPISNRSDQFARFQSDAPSCDNCGAITVRNGNCYLCHNCGNSMGCS